MGLFFKISSTVNFPLSTALKILYLSILSLLSRTKKYLLLYISTYLFLLSNLIKPSIRCILHVIFPLFQETITLLSLLTIELEYIILILTKITKKG